MGRNDRTVMGGADGSFHTTLWAQVLDARTEDPVRRRAALEPLLARYWKPTYCYLRRKGYDNETSKDLTQRFLLDILLARDLIQKADPAQGKFRTFLLCALDRFLIDVYREETAKKRLPQDGLLSLDGFEDPSSVEPSSGGTPVDAYNRAWAGQLLEDVLSELERELSSNGMAVHWQLFLERVFRPITEGAEPPDLPTLCARFKVASEIKASNMIVTAKRHYQAILCRRVRDLVGSDAAVNDEIAELMRILSENRAG